MRSDEPEGLDEVGTEVDVDVVEDPSHAMRSCSLYLRRLVLSSSAALRTEWCIATLGLRADKRAEYGRAGLRRRICGRGQ